MVVGVIFEQTTVEEISKYSQMPSKRSIKKFGECAVAAIIKE